MNDTYKGIDRIGPFAYQRFAPTVPLLDNGSEPVRHKVIIVGGGPVGLATALGLARFGVSSVVIEADDSVCEGSRAACISRRSLQIVERLGALDQFLEKGLRWSRGRSFYREHEVFDFTMHDDPSEKLPPMINLQQYYIEHFLLQAIERVNASTPGVIDVRWNSRVTRFVALDAGAELEVDNGVEKYRTSTDWLVACDGGQSFVRKELGLELKGTAYEGRYVIIDIELPSNAPTERRAWFDPPWWPGSTILMHRQPDNIWRIDYQLRDGDSPEDALSPSRVQEFVQTHLDAIGEGHLPWKPVWTSVYRAGAMTLDSYRHGRILFAGNAAHAMPIFGVRGLNSGFDDADNLAWKLALVATGRANEALLDGYSAERIEAFHENAANAMRSTEFMSPPSRGFDLMREACLSLAKDNPSIAKLVNPRQTHAVTYSVNAGTPDTGFDAGPAPGSVAVDLPLDIEGRFLSDVFDFAAFTLLGFGMSAGRVRTLADLVAKIPVPVQVRNLGVVGSEADLFAAADEYEKILQSYGAADGCAYLLRPDGHVAARWRQPSVEDVWDGLSRACATVFDELEESCHS
ncbi:3-(3-hydroxy-phenyl)propionate/3-hydroxycinnamic acid hydroxylase [Paraburkholderia caffeinitolerans]|uniref:3-(3-hydroxy-phenyl)propionate/3-hydroxycinnamic acid hydroxylase n=1 Tax=Paraburkholderia caffeinitolerans TaxID=1723730 RepID=A0A6J5GVN9_9BURK|nr:MULTISPECIES: FAD-dependent monooxygenase [Paraburkholderia]CAB3807082.1 3-(3-hydroxy-phenyl)propionate/3-hydroxycinnamic acid hydroxylase [Paraburkholderia caffeinitolerans]